jgi:hypothetical protein
MKSQTRAVAGRIGATGGTGAKNSATATLDSLQAFLQRHRVARKFVPGEFESFEKALHERVMGFERDLLREEIAACDADAEAIVIKDKTLRRVLKSAQTYMTAAGSVVVERWLYKDRTDEESRAVSPLESRLGIVDFWTPHAAKQALWVVTQMTPGKAEEMFERMGNMTPSKSSLDRLPKTLSRGWEADREQFEETLRAALKIPDEATTVAVSLDGVLSPFDGAPVEKRARAAEEGRMCKGPVGYKEVGCGTLSFCDSEGEMIAAVRIARSPEWKKLSLKASLAAELAAVLRARPDLRIVKIADTGGNNWEFLSGELPAGDEAVDFFHSAEHLHEAVANAYGDATRETRHRFEVLRDALRDDDGGVDKVIRAIDHLRRKFPRKPAIERELKYFRKHRHRMRYSALLAQGLPIGSGVVEAACKTLVSQRLKLSGMRWSNDGAQAILTARGWDQSERFDEAWALLAATYQTDIQLLSNVIPIRPPPRQKRASR